MQGASADTTPKWSSDIPNLLTHDVIVFGRRPAGTRYSARMRTDAEVTVHLYVGSVGTGAGIIYHSTRNFGYQEPPWSSAPRLLHADDPNVQPGNLAMVTERRATQQPLQRWLRARRTFPHPGTHNGFPWCVRRAFPG